MSEDCVRALQRATIPRTGGRPSHAGVRQCDAPVGEHMGDPPRQASSLRTAGDEMSTCDRPKN